MSHVTIRAARGNGVYFPAVQSLDKFPQTKTRNLKEKAAEIHFWDLEVLDLGYRL